MKTMYAMNLKQAGEKGVPRLIGFLFGIELKINHGRVSL
jgi:hypothetical protein